MSKPFFEVFPTLKVKDDIQMMFHGVEVTKFPQILRETLSVSAFTADI